NRENPCFLCARLRRNRLFKLAQEQGCRKIALGHNKDDIIETLFINMFYSGKIGTMKPRQSFFGGALDIIRPLAYVEKKDIVLFSNLFGMPEFVNNCPSANQTKREEIRRMLDALYKQNKNIKGNIFRAMGNVASDYLLENKND
ncbi:MAG: tRNA 2-thiocytidine(32) synthetase TtcA, partial [Proteobacteria bacterium]|nr:tRNA 2-thiocytidine(32) synthetase TtcA [Pseudomonadota bacterium]